MITEALISVVFGIGSSMLRLLPEFTWSVDLTGADLFMSIIQVVAYLVPWQHVAAIVSLILGLGVFRITISAIRTVWDLLPFV